MSEVAQVPKLRFPEYDGEWDVSQLGDIARIYDGTHQTPKYVESGIPFYSVEHITANQFGKTKYISEDVFKHENKRVKLERADILMTRIGNIGMAKYIDWDVRASFYVSLALIKQSENFNSKFLSQLIHSPNFQRQLWKRTIHVAFPQKINLGEIGKCLSALPTKPEQQKIAAFLTAVDTKIEQLSKKQVLLGEYKKGLMQKIFSQAIRFKADDGSEFPDWEEKKLGDVTKITTGNSNREDSGLDGKYKFFDRSEDIRTSDRYLFDGKAVIVAGEGSSFPPKYFEGKFDLHQRTYAIMDFIEADSKYIFYFMDKHKNKNYLLRYAVGSTVKSLRLPIFQKMPVNLPSLPEQTKIANFLTSIDSKIEQVGKQLNESKQFKKALLQQMFV